MNKNKLIDDYYDLANIVDNDIVIVALLIQIQKIKPLVKVVKDLENLNLDKYSKEIDNLLDFKIETLKDLAYLYNNTSFDFEIKKISKKINKDTNLLNLIEEVE